MRKEFYNYIRNTLFDGKLTKPQVEGLEALMDMYEASNWPISWRAYSLATTYHETAKTIQPITEYGFVRYFDKYDTGRLAKILGNTPDKDGDGFKYRGRGFEQLTGLANYKKATMAIGVDLVNNPDLLLDLETAIKVHQWGVTSGAYTGKSFKSYLTQDLGTLKQFIAARRVINGQDRAEKIAGYAVIFQEALKCI